MSADPKVDEPQIDEDLQSRQLAVYGREAMAKLSKANVLVSGLNGLGAEIVKNVSLANVKGLTLHDTAATTAADLGSNFYLGEDDIGVNRAEACLTKMQELNPAVKTVASSRELDNKFLSKFDAVVLVDVPLEEACRVNEYCHTHRPPIPFMYARAAGLTGAAFTDLGEKFPVYDWSGEPIRSSIVASISQAKNAAVRCVFDEKDPQSRHDLQEGDVIEFTEVQGMTEINGLQGTVTKVVNAWAFEVDIDTTEFGEYFDGGIITEKRQPVYMDFRSLRESLEKPGEFIVGDWSKWGRSALLHQCFIALDTFATAHDGALPRPGNAADADEVVAIVQELVAAATERLDAEEEELRAKRNALGLAAATLKSVTEELSVSAAAAGGCNAAAEELEASRKAIWKRLNEIGQERVGDVDAAVVKKFAMGSSAVINPICALFGGIVAQEVVKSLTSKYTPVHQWMHFDSFESLPEEMLEEAEYAPEGGRYDHMIAVYGRTIVEKLRSQRVFLVGAGALGCEYLKNFAMMGMGCSENGGIWVTDDDVIERSNLSRQFLFRNWHVKQPKSTTAGEAAMAMNPGLTVTSMQERVSPDTEDIFDESYWQNLTLVVNALDNVKARLYVDERCIFFGKSLLESGTLGPKCNTQVIHPPNLENYGASRDPPEFQAPACTIHSFPHTIVHCLLWAKSEFTGLFSTVPTEVQRVTEAGSLAAYVDSMKANGASQGDILNNLRGDENWGGGIQEFVEAYPASFEDCVQWARDKFESYANHRISQLVHILPEDAINHKTGGRFWQAPKRFPTPFTEFDLDDEMCFQFVVSCAMLRANTVGVATPTKVTKDSIAAILSGHTVAAYEIRSDMKIDTDESGDNTDAVAAATDDEALIAELVDTLDVAKIDADRVGAEEFEKDDDTNYHIAFIQALGNIRARCYKIGEIDYLNAKLKVGQVIPAIATATAAITGFTMLEAMKIISGCDDSALRNGFFNLGVSIASFSEPSPVDKVTSRTETRRPDPENFPDYEEEVQIVALPDPHCVYDAIVIDEGDITMGELCDWFEKLSKGTLSVSSMGYGSAALYLAWSGSADEVKAKKVTELAVERAGADLSKNYLLLEPLLNGPAGEEAELPCVIFKFAHPCPLDGVRDVTTSLGQAFE